MINYCIFIGRVGSINRTADYTQFSLALNEKDKNDMQVTTWVNFVAFGKLKTDIVDKYLSKGDTAYVASKYTATKKNEKDYHSFIARELRIVNFANKKQSEASETIDDTTCPF